MSDPHTKPSQKRRKTEEEQFSSSNRPTVLHNTSMSGWSRNLAASSSLSMSSDQGSLAQQLQIVFVRTQLETSASSASRELTNNGWPTLVALNSMEGQVKSEQSETLNGSALSFEQLERTAAALQLQLSLNQSNPQNGTGGERSTDAVDGEVSSSRNVAQEIFLPKDKIEEPRPLKSILKKPTCRSDTMKSLSKVTPGIEPSNQQKNDPPKEVSLPSSTRHMRAWNCDPSTSRYPDRPSIGIPPSIPKKVVQKLAKKSTSKSSKAKETAASSQSFKAVRPTKSSKTAKRKLEYVLKESEVAKKKKPNPSSSIFPSNDIEPFDQQKNAAHQSAPEQPTSTPSATEQILAMGSSSTSKSSSKSLLLTFTAEQELTSNCVPSIFKSSEAMDITLNQDIELFDLWKDHAHQAAPKPVNTSSAREQVLAVNSSAKTSEAILKTERDIKDALKPAETNSASAEDAKLTEDGQENLLSLQHIDTPSPLLLPENSFLRIKHFDLHDRKHAKEFTTDLAQALKSEEGIDLNKKILKKTETKKEMLVKEIEEIFRAPISKDKSLKLAELREKEEEKDYVIALLQKEKAAKEAAHFDFMKSVKEKYSAKYYS